MSSEWPQVLIGDLADPRPGSLAVGPFGSRMKADLYVPAGVRVIRGNNLGEGLQLKGDFVHVTNGTADSLASCCLTPGDLVFPHRGNIGEVGITPDDGHRYMLSTSLMKLSPNRSKVDSLYLLYFFKSVTGRAALLMNASQVGTPGIATPLKSLRGIALALPPLEIQRAITAVLQALDDRITLLRETNATLEAIAQALFKSWFVDFDPVRAKMEGRTPEGMDEATAALFPDGFETSELGEVPRGWRWGTLGDVAETVRNQIQPESMQDTLHYVGLEHIPRKCLSLSDWGVAEGLESAKSCFSAGDILFGKLRPYFHKVVVAPVDGVCSTDILVCRPTKPCFYGFAAMQLFSESLITYADRLSNGAKMPRVNWKDLAAYPLIIPSADVADVFTATIQPLLNRMAANVHQAQTLSTLRDTLLPRLISGQLRLPEAQAATEAALGGALSV